MRGLAGASDVGDGLAGGDRFADFDGDGVPAEVPVLGIPASGVLDDDSVWVADIRGPVVPVEFAVAGPRDDAGGGRDDGDSFIHLAEVQGRDIRTPMAVVDVLIAAAVVGHGPGVAVVVNVHHEYDVFVQGRIDRPVNRRLGE